MHTPTTSLGLFTLLLAAASAPGQACPNPEFLQTDFAAGVASRAVAIGDLDGDGDLDMAIANSSTTSGIIYNGTEGAHVLLNNGDGTFGPKQFLSVGTAPQSMALGDIDGDGDLDMVAAQFGQYGNGWMNYGVDVLLNDGSGNFGSAVLHPLDPGYVEPRSAVLGDLDHDGDLDVVVTVGYSSYLHSEVAVMLNAGGGVLESPQYFPTGYGPHCVALADLNGDGDLDAVTANYTANSVSTLLGDGNGGFGSPSHGYAGEQPRWVTLADLNGNGVPDISVANHDGLIIKLDGGGVAFQPVGLRPTCIAAGDLDADGDLDLVAPNSLSDNATVLWNDGSGGFGETTTLLAGNAAYGATIADLDNSGFNDFVVVNMYENTASVFLNECAGPCTGDLDGDGTVDGADLGLLLGSWGDDGAADLDLNGTVDGADLGLLLGAWGPCP